MPVAAAVAAVVSLAVGAAAAADPGVTAREIVIGGTVPLSGEAAAFGSVGPGAKAYFDYVNAKGGVNGRRIRYVFYDDAYNPAQTVQLTRRLVEQDKVLAIFNSVGTANNLAVREYLNALEVPQLFVGRRLAGARREPEALPVDDALSAELPRRRCGLRSRCAQTPTRREDRCAAREHGARQGHDARALARDCRQGPEGRRLGELRVHRRGRLRPGRPARRHRVRIR